MVFQFFFVVKQTTLGKVMLLCIKQYFKLFGSWVLGVQDLLSVCSNYFLLAQAMEAVAWNQWLRELQRTSAVRSCAIC
jgi:hypothetical protein